MHYMHIIFKFRSCTAPARCAFSRGTVYNTQTHMLLASAPHGGLVRHEISTRRDTGTLFALCALRTSARTRERTVLYSVERTSSHTSPGTQRAPHHHHHRRHRNGIQKVGHTDGRRGRDRELRARAKRKSADLNKYGFRI